MRRSTLARRAVDLDRGRATDVAQRAQDAAVRKAGGAGRRCSRRSSRRSRARWASKSASLNVQVHGGMGFVEETGAAQHLRDSRIIPIYEGTNGIQAIDLVTRKVKRDGGTAAKAELDDSVMFWTNWTALAEGSLGDMSTNLAQAIDALEEATNWVLVRSRRG